MILRRSGHTLLELLVAIAILGLVAAVVSMAPRRPVADDADEEGRQLSDILSQAQRAAVSTGIVQRLRVRVTPDLRVVAETDDAAIGTIEHVTAHADGSVVLSLSVRARLRVHRPTAPEVPR